MYPSRIEIFSVPNPTIAQTYAGSSATWLSGDVESVLNIPTALFGDRPYVLTSNETKTTFSPMQWLITDGNQRYAMNFGRNRDNRSYVLGPLETGVNGVSLLQQQLRPRRLENQTVQTLSGISSITASSVGPGIIQRAMANSQPSNVLDGDPSTSWRPNRLSLGRSNDWGGDQWIDIRFDVARVVDPLSITLLQIRILSGG